MRRRPHIWDWNRDVCICCGRKRQDVVEHNVDCDGVPKYREWLIGMTYVREPIIPQRGGHHD